MPRGRLFVSPSTSHSSAMFTTIPTCPLPSACPSLAFSNNLPTKRLYLSLAAAGADMDHTGLSCCNGMVRTRRLAHSFLCLRALASRSRDIPQNVDLPPVLPKSKKKPYLTPPRRGSWLRKKGGQQQDPILLPAPANGLVVPQLIPVARKVLEARATLIRGVMELLKVVPVRACRFCSEVHIGSVGHGIATCRGPQCSIRRSHHDWSTGTIDDVITPMDTYHLTDRIGIRIRHDERFDVARIPAVIELCIQAGIDIPEYPTKRRTKPVYYIGKRAIEPHNMEDLSQNKNVDSTYIGFPMKDDESIIDRVEASLAQQSRGEENITDAGFRESRLDQFGSVPHSIIGEVGTAPADMSVIADQTLEAWDAMRSGAKKLMLKYPVKVCGYCPEVHVGPIGHAVKLCGAFKHQWRAGQHGWQAASVDDVIPPNYVWHVRDLDGPPLLNELRTYYGQAPAVVELCLQAGAALPEIYRPMLRLDIAIPDKDEFMKAV